MGRFAEDGAPGSRAARRGGQDAPSLKVGIVGCGGRGTGAIENVLEAADNVLAVAMGDMFKDRLDRSRAHMRAKKPPGFKLDDDRCFTGFDAFRGVIDAGVDYVMLTEPPGFRPRHFEAAVAAGKHVFLEKPVAVEQHMHQHDVAAWVMRARPVSATAVGGRQVRIEPLWGNIYDRFFVDYEYPDGVHVMAMCRQWANTPDLSPERYEFGPDPARPVPVPGKYKRPF